mmetsp:Transcript_21402/g.42494  ORF Transcript_21402/g.42494 Transcript_21402/m.42494 type:complete len:211 (-) Transcript_21402:106-738(-)
MEATFSSTGCIAAERGGTPAKIPSDSASSVSNSPGTYAMPPVRPTKIRGGQGRCKSGREPNASSPILSEEEAREVSVGRLDESSVKGWMWEGMEGGPLSSSTVLRVLFTLCWASPTCVFTVSNRSVDVRESTGTTEDGEEEERDPTRGAEREKADFSSSRGTLGSCRCDVTTLPVASCLFTSDGMTITPPVCSVEAREEDSDCLASTDFG